MKKSYTIAGLGVCLGGKPGCEILAESVITGSSALGAELADSLNLAVQEALRYTGNKNLPVITDTQAPELGEQKICGSSMKCWKMHRKMSCFSPTVKMAG